MLLAYEADAKVQEAETRKVTDQLHKSVAEKEQMQRDYKELLARHNALRSAVESATSDDHRVQLEAELSNVAVKIGSETALIERVTALKQQKLDAEATIQSLQCEIQEAKRFKPEQPAWFMELSTKFDEEQRKLDAITPRLMTLVTPIRNSVIQLVESFRCTLCKNST